MYSNESNNFSLVEHANNLVVLSMSRCYKVELRSFLDLVQSASLKEFNAHGMLREASLLELRKRLSPIEINARYHRYHKKAPRFAGFFGPFHVLEVYKHCFHLWTSYECWYRLTRAGLNHTKSSFLSHRANTTTRWVF